MSATLSRTKIARYVAHELEAGNSAVIRELAAFLVEERRTRELDLYVRSILEQLEASGTVLVDVTAIENLDQTMKNEIKALTGAKKLEIREHIDPTVLGGVRIETPTKRLDATFVRRLSQLRERKI
ncbi:MAG TPA: F0F1 ATP synthase subunit delta [Patescibacteria group bacterium]|jgi:F-type H+-transporting ATPase subunit delta|nr:F0F1 ATP synthase subunit delta [Patescibacteria group bacterium]